MVLMSADQDKSGYAGSIEKNSKELKFMLGHHSLGEVPASIFLDFKISGHHERGREAHFKNKHKTIN